MPLGYQFGAESDRGSIRERNEDYYGIYVPESEDILASLGVLAIVADGMGGISRAPKRAGNRSR